MASVSTKWSCGCSDVYNFDVHQGGSYLCNDKVCVRKAAAKDDLILFPLPPPPGGSNGG